VATTETRPTSIAPASSRPSWTLHRSLRSHSDSVNAVCVHPSNSLFFSVGEDNTLKAWDLAAGTVRLTLVESQPLNAVCVPDDPRSAELFCAGKEREVSRWDLHRNRRVSQFHGHRHAILALATPPDSSFLLASGGRDNAVRVWDVRAARAVMKLVHPNASSVFSVAWRAGRPEILTGADQGRHGAVFAFDIRAPGVQLSTTASGHRRRRPVGFDNIATSRLQEYELGPLQTLTHHSRAVHAVAVHPTEPACFSAGADALRRWTLASQEGQAVACGVDALSFDGELPQPFRPSATTTLEHFAANIPHSMAIEASPDGLLAAGFDDGTTRIYDPLRGELLQIVSDGCDGLSKSVLGVSFDRSGQRLITGCRDGVVRIWKKNVA
jgi:pleiotropic regulator 1